MFFAQVHLKTARLPLFSAVFWAKYARKHLFSAHFQTEKARPHLLSAHCQTKNGRKQAEPAFVRFLFDRKRRGRASSVFKNGASKVFEKMQPKYKKSLGTHGMHGRTLLRCHCRPALKCHCRAHLNVIFGLDPNIFVERLPHQVRQWHKINH